MDSFLLLMMILRYYRAILVSFPYRTWLSLALLFHANNPHTPLCSIAPVPSTMILLNVLSFAECFWSFTIYLPSTATRLEFVNSTKHPFHQA